MSVFTISDLHLSVDNPSKSMAAFGNRWTDYTQKILSNWNSVVSAEDTVIVPGDISWASSLNDSLPDLRFLDSLNGRKIISKGNHDFWWSTVSKLNTFFAENNLNTLSVLYNSATVVEDIIITGTRGWFADPAFQNTVQKTDYNKIINREAIRLELALKEAQKLQSLTNKEIVAFFHFPPLWKDFCDEKAFELMSECNVKRCFYGHIHGNYNVSEKITHNGIDLYMISADYLSFIPKLI